jgi:hypothetical protein
MYANLPFHAGNAFSTLHAADILALMHSRRRPPKYYQPAITATGPEAATALRMQRNLHGGRSSSLRKLQRILRVEAGLRPQRFKTVRPSGRSQ